MVHRVLGWRPPVGPAVWSRSGSTSRSGMGGCIAEGETGGAAWPAGEAPREELAGSEATGLQA